MKIRRSFILTCLISSSSLAGLAQYAVKGRVIEGLQSEPVPMAVYHVYMANDTLHPKYNNVTDSEGKFNQNLQWPGKYFFIVDYLGQRSDRKPFEVTKDNPVVDLGDIKFGAHDVVLGEVVVKASKPVVESSGTSLTYNVTEDPSSKSSTMMDMLRKVPMVTVDGDNNIKVNGSSNFKIYLNGKPNPMLSGNASTIFKSMPASSVKKIEVITDPGAKYDAEGTGGILNIVTETNRNLDGYLLNASVGFENNMWNAYMLGRKKIRNVTVNGNIVYAGSTFNAPFANGGSSSEYLTSATQHYLETERRQKEKDISFTQGSFDLSWEPDTLNLVTLSASILNLQAGVDMYGKTGMYDIKGKKLWTYNEFSGVKIHNLDLTLNTAYQHNFGTSDHNIVLSYLLSYGKQNTGLSSIYSDFDNYWMENPFVNSFNNNYNREHTVQLDYTLPLVANHKLELGAKGLFRRNSGISEKRIGASEGNTFPVSSDDVDMAQFQDVAAAYASYSALFGKFSSRLGLRYEFTRMGANFRDGAHEDFSSNLSDLVPDASITFKQSSKNTFTLSYQMRISRPTVSQLNPGRISINGGLNVQTGNPDLSSQRNNTVTLTYSGFLGKVMLRSALSYSNASNLISSFTKLEDDCIIQTYENSGIRHRWALDMFVNWNISPKVSMSINGDASYNRYKFSDQNMSRNGWGGDIRGNFNWMLPYDMRFNAYGGWMSRSVSLQGYYSGFNYHGVSLSKSFLKNKNLSLTLSANNIFHPFSTFSSRSVDPGKLISNMYMRRSSWRVGFSVSWTLGTLRSQVKKAASNIKNDDKSDVSNNNSANGGGVSM